ncbi:Crp/Fnr family transcriptional regulator [Variovorax paradoxus]|uniref:Crp/Fnr family transcriptional regulator n=1 Tax=Variovorax paradoxus TaxID=34073 RepID=UPI001ABD2A0B
MEDERLKPEERDVIDRNRWFSSLSPAMRHDVLRRAFVERFKHGEPLSLRGDPPWHWAACLQGAVRIGSTTASGKAITLTYVEPGIWFGDISVFDGKPNTHDAYAHGKTAVLYVARHDFLNILEAHPELHGALMRLQASRVRMLFRLIEDFNVLSLRARVAKQLMYLMRGPGAPGGTGDPASIRLRLSQQALAQLLGASRQRVNMELKAMEYEGVIRIESSAVMVLDKGALGCIFNSDA